MVQVIFKINLHLIILLGSLALINRFNKHSQMSKSKKKQVQIEEEVDESQLKGDYILKPSNEGPKTDSSEWPLLLKVTFNNPEH